MDDIQDVLMSRDAGSDWPESAGTGERRFDQKKKATQFSLRGLDS